MSKDISIAIAAILLVLGVAFGLERVRPDLPLTPSQPFTAASSGSGAAKKLAANDKVVMRVNGEPVTEREFAGFMATIPEQQRPMFATPEGKRQLATEIVRMKALEQEGRKLGIADDPQMTMQFELLRTQVTAQRALEKIVNAKVEQQIVAEFEKSKNAALTLRHIVVGYQGGAVPPRDGGQPLSPEAAMQKASAIVTRLRGGADFAQTARAESDDANSAPRGGVLGPLQPGGLPPEIENVVRTLQPGQVSNPVRTQFGIHVFDVVRPTLEDFRPMVQQQVQQQVVEAEVKRIEALAKVELDPAFFPQTPAQSEPRPGAPPQAPPRSNG